MKETIDDFHANGYDFLSNFFQYQVRYECILYPSSEHAFQAAKTLDIKVRKLFTIEGMTPAQAKTLGREIKCRSDWDAVKLSVMDDILAAKFSDLSLKRLLIDTGDAELIEGNTWNDTFWGVCNGKGSNFLGKALMNLRKNLTTPAA